jgi:methyl-accepting chemotaxis protein
MEFFANANIPLTCESNKEFKDYDSLLAIENILTGIEYFRANLNDDTVLKYVYTSIGRSFLFNYEDKQIYDSMTNLRDTLALFVENIKASAECVDVGSAQMAQCSMELANGTTNQALSVDELSNTLKDIYFKIENNVKIVEDVANSVEQLNNVANNSEHAMLVLLQNVTNIHEISSSITKIIDDIEAISDETNLLSLNASIESARAGEVGKGFANVANEIQGLAQQTENLIKDINDIMLKLDDNAKKAGKVVQNIVKSVGDENVIIDNTIKDFIAIEKSIKGLGENVYSILDKVENVVNYSYKIEENITVLAASSKQTASITDKTVKLNEENRVKAEETKKLMINLNIIR